jgi:predicted nucleic acid-binding protein
MMASFLLDTNVLSEIIRPQPSDSVLSFLSTSEDLWLSVVALHEISYGATRLSDHDRQIRLEAWLQSLKVQYKGRIIDVDETIAETAGRLRGYGAARGRVLAPLDSLIAATAMTRSHVLATRNIRDFDYLNMDLCDPWTP